MTKRKVYSNSRAGRSSRPNRGGSRDNAPRGNDNRPDGRSNNYSPFPSPVILQEYEYAEEGAARRIIEMAEIEQERRNAWEDEYLRFYKKSLRIGQLLGFLLLLAVVGAFVYLSEQGKEEAAQVLAMIAFASVVLTSVFSSRKKKRYPRRPRR